MVPARLPRKRGSWGNSLNEFPSGEKGVGPYENALNVVPYGERAVWPDETAKAKVQAQASRPIELGAAFEL